CFWLGIAKPGDRLRCHRPPDKPRQRKAEPVFKRQIPTTLHVLPMSCARTSLQGMIFWQTGNIGRIGKQSFAFGLDESETILAQAPQAYVLDRAESRTENGDVTHHPIPTG